MRVSGSQSPPDLRLRHWFSTGGDFVPPLPPQDMCQCLKTFLVVTLWGEAGRYWYLTGMPLTHKGQASSDPGQYQTC